MTYVDEKDDGGEVTAAIGQRIRIELSETRTAGYKWRTVSDGAPTCGLISDGSVPPPDDVPGRPGHHWWIFECRQAGRARIELAKRRSWSPEDEATTFRLFVVVTS